MRAIQAPPLKTVEVNGARLHYTEAGEGDPVVFVHGSLGDYRTWTYQMEQFAEQYRAIAYSRRYHYPNDWSGDGSDYSARLHAEDLREFLMSLELAPAHVVSASYGSYAALLLASERPELFRTLTVGEPPMLRWLETLPGGEELAADFRRRALEPSHAAFARGDDEEGVRLFIDGVSGREGVFDRFPPSVRQAVMDNVPEMRAQSQAPDIFPAFTCSEAARVTVPVLLLSGERSPALFHRVTDELAQCLPNSERRVIPGVSHALNSGKPRLYNEVVLEFLQRHGGVRR